MVVRHADLLQRASRAVQNLHTDAGTFLAHYHSHPNQAAGLQSNLTTGSTNLSFNARVEEERRAGTKRGLARLYGAKAKYAPRWKLVKPTEAAYQLSDEFYRYAARRDLGLPPTRDRVLPSRCAACGLSVAADGLHGQRCIFTSAARKLRHDTIEVQLVETVRDGVGIAYRQEHNLPAAERTIPDLVIYLGNKTYLCDVTVAAIKQGEKARKYAHVASRLGAELLNVSVDTCGGLASDAFNLVRAIAEEGEKWSAGTWSNARIERQLLGAIAIAVQRGNATIMLTGYTRATSAHTGSARRRVEREAVSEGRLGSEAVGQERSRGDNADCDCGADALVVRS